MDIQQINSQTSEAFTQREAPKQGSMGQQDFLQLLVAQMRHQDPINPLDGTEFATQLAQFNSVEQLINVNNGLQTLQESHDMMSTSLTNSMAVSLTGKQVRALGDQIHLSSGKNPVVQYRLNSAASDVEVIIKNANGTEVRREQLNGAVAGNNTWEWDGRNNSGERMPDGTYSVEIVASNNGTPVDSLVFIEGIAERVRYSGNGVYLSVNGAEVPIGDIEEVGTGLF